MPTPLSKGQHRVIVCILGTSAEAIKVQPVLRRLRDRGVEFEIWATYQHTDSLDATLESLNLPKPSYVFTRGSHGKPIERPREMLAWLSNCFIALARDKRTLKSRLGSNPLIIVHGDTVTTVFGAIAAKVLGSPSAHIEAGLRSGRLSRPFPEELDRRIVGRLATVHFAPNDEAVRNLRNRDAVNTNRNTAVDGVLDVLGTVNPTLQTPYGLVLLHRYEFISQPDLVRETVRALSDNSPIPLIVLTDAFSGGVIGESVQALGAKNIRSIEKLPYPEFVNFMAHAEFVFTDSGGLQQEAGLLGVPTMLHRQVTESPDGMGSNVILSNWDFDKVKYFLANFAELRHPIDSLEISPSEIIVEALSDRGYFD